MIRKHLKRLASLATAAAAAGVTAAPAVAEPPVRPEVKVVRLEPGDSQYLLLLAGPPETGSMRSGLVTLAPAPRSACSARTGGVLVPLEGEGELRIMKRAASRSARPDHLRSAHTEHDVVNTGTARSYIFIVARAGRRPDRSAARPAGPDVVQTGGQARDGRQLCRTFM
jgi:hypothetical protein